MSWATWASAGLIVGLCILSLGIFYFVWFITKLCDAADERHSRNDDPYDG